jgi:hypothetical protein
MPGTSFASAGVRPSFRIAPELPKTKCSEASQTRSGFVAETRVELGLVDIAAHGDDIVAPADQNLVARVGGDVVGELGEGGRLILHAGEGRPQGLGVGK